MYINYTVHNRWDSKQKAFKDIDMHLFDSDAIDFKREIEKHYSSKLVKGHIEQLCITINWISED